MQPKMEVHKGLVGEEIPLVARIMAVADAFDAMISRRIYRNQIDIENTLNEFRNDNGKQFDQLVIDAFLDLFSKGKMEVLGTRKASKVEQAKDNLFIGRRLL